MARVKKIKIKGFTIIDNDIINDPRMHLKALGLFAYMWSKPDDWQFYISEIATHFKDGESAVSSAMKELMELGYLMIMFSKKYRNQKITVRYRKAIYRNQKNRNRKNRFRKIKDY